VVVTLGRESSSRLLGDLVAILFFEQVRKNGRVSSAVVVVILRRESGRKAAGWEILLWEISIDRVPRRHVVDRRDKG